MRGQRSHFAVALIAAMLCSTAPLPATAYEDGLNALNALYKGDYETALRIWKPLAEQGEKSAQFNLGLMYYFGNGVPQDYGEAMKWYREAADQGDAMAQVNLAVMYANGRGATQNFTEATKWFRKAADQGFGAGQALLGMMYWQGRGVEHDNIEAYKWLDLAAANYPPAEIEARQDTVTARDRVASEMTPVQIASAKKLAKAWKPRR